MTTLAQGMFSITSVMEGYTALLSNDSVSIATDKDGNNPVLNGASTTVSLTLGATAVTAYIPTSPASFTRSGCTVTVSGTTVTLATVTADTGYVDIPVYSNSARTSEYLVVTKRFSFSKARQGNTGEQGLRGLQGVQGEQGIRGATGANGISSYTHIAYSTSPTGATGFSTSNPNGATYIGMYVDSEPTDSKEPSKYKWTLIKGADGTQGIQGPTGADGKTSYLHIAYATNSTGTSGFDTVESAGKTYIGQYTDFISTDSKDPALYTWTLIKGDKGDTGAQGVSITKVDVMYYLSTSSTVLTGGSWSTLAPDWIDGRFMWSKTVTTYSSGNPTESKPACITGQKGSAGKGITSAVVTYQNHTNGSTAPTGTWSATVPTLVKGQYLWTRTITTYTDASSIPTYSVAYNATDGQNGTNGKGILSTVIDYQLSTSGTVTPTSTWVASPPTPVKGQYLWARTVINYTTGSPSTSYSTSYYATDGQKGDKGDTGASGADAITILLSNESHTFAGNISNALAGSTVVNIIAYKGATRVVSSIGTITGQVTGLTASIAGNGTTSNAFTVSATTDLVTPNGVLTIPITVDGKVFTKSFSFAVSFKGATGSPGSSGADAKVITLTASAQIFTKPKTGAVAPSAITVAGTTQNTTIATWQYSTNGGAFTTTLPTGVTRSGNVVTISGTTMNVKTIAIKAFNGVVEDTTTIAKVEDGVDGATGKGVTSITEEYAISTSKTTAPADDSFSTTRPTWIAGSYIWTRSKIVYDNPTSTVYTTKVVSSEWEAINEIEIGGRNLIVLSKLYSYSKYSTAPTITNGVISTVGAGTASALTLAIGGWTPENIQYTLSGTMKKNGAPVTNAMWTIKRASTNSPSLATNSFYIDDATGKFVITETYRGSSVWIFHAFVTFGVGDVITIENFKMEKGNKATDWTPAPEDVDSAIGVALTNAATAQTTADKAKAYTESLASDSVITPDEKFSLKREWDLIVVEGTPTTGKIPAQAALFGVSAAVFNTAYAALNTYLNTNLAVFADMKTEKIGISRGVWDTAWKNYYNARTDLLNAIATTTKTYAESIQVGGRNLLRNGANFKNTDYWTHMPGSIDTVNTYLGGNTIKATGGQTFYHQTIRLKPNTYYVYSYVAKATVATHVGGENTPVHIQIWTDENPSNIHQEIYTGDFKTTISKDDWSNCYRVFKTPNSATWVYMVPYVHGFGANTVNFTNFQVEEGNKPTDWSPAPEDVDSKIAAAQATANGKNVVFYQTAAPPTTGRVVGDTWFDSDDGNSIYKWSGAEWTRAQFGTNAIASLDAGKITTGHIQAARVAAGSLTADKIKGGTLVLGGSGANSNGVLSINSSAGTEVVRGDNQGLLVDGGSYKIKDEFGNICNALSSSNLISNGGFELFFNGNLDADGHYLSTKIEGWTPQGTIRIANTGSYSGLPQTCRYDGVASATMTSAGSCSQPFSAFAGTTYTVSFCARLNPVKSSGVSSGGVVVRALKGSTSGVKETVGTASYSKTFAVSQAWSRYSYTFVASNLPNNLRLDFLELHLTSTTAAWVMIDCVQVVEGSLPCLIEAASPENWIAPERINNGDLSINGTMKINDYHVVSSNGPWKIYATYVTITKGAWTLVDYSSFNFTQGIRIFTTSFNGTSGQALVNNESLTSCSVALPGTLSGYIYVLVIGV